MIEFSGGRVATTGQFKTITDPHGWIRTRGGIPVLWSLRTDFLMVGEDHVATSWKLQQAARTSNIRIVYESQLPAPEKTLWVDKFRPKRLADVIGHAATIKDLVGWLSNWGRAGPHAALLTGPPGIGKTTVAHLMAAECGYTVVEFNASDERSAKAVREILERMGRVTTLGAATAKRILIMDEVDGMSSGDRGGLVELARVIREGSFAHPILCLANDRSSPKIRGLASACLDIRFSRPTKTTIAKALAGRGLGAAKDIEDMCERNGNDIRSILNSLQFSSSGASSADKDETHRLDPFSATGRLFGTAASLEDRERAFFVDHSLVPLMVGEAILAAAGKTRGPGDPLEAAWRAADAMGNWDILDRKIHKDQNWSLLPAASMAVIQAARAANGPPPFQIFPSWLGKQSKRTKHRRLMGEMGQHMGGGGCDLDTRAFLRTKLFDATLGPAQIVGELNGLGLTRDDMLETLVDTVFKGDEGAVAMDTKKKTALTREWKKTGISRTSNIVASVAAVAASSIENCDDIELVDAYDSDEEEGML